MEQRSSEWFKQRLGKITASEIHSLMKDHKEPMSDEELAQHKAANPKSRTTTKTAPFSDASYTYLNRKVMENLLPLHIESCESIIDDYIEEHSVINRAMQWGVFWEDKAREMYAETMGYEVIEVGFVPYKKYPNLVGVSPDGLIREEEGGIEIKCPYTLEKHFQHLMYQTQEDLKQGDEQYYWQVYANMLVCDCKFWDFVSFNPYLSKDKQLKVLRIHRREDEITLLKERIDLAAEYMKGKLSELGKVQMIIK